MPLLKVRSGRWLVPILYGMSDDTSMLVYLCFSTARYGRPLALVSDRQYGLRGGWGTFVFASHGPGRRVRIFHEIKLYLSGYLPLNAIPRILTINPIRILFSTVLFIPPRSL